MTVGWDLSSVGAMGLEQPNPYSFCLFAVDRDMMFFIYETQNLKAFQLNEQ